MTLFRISFLALLLTLCMNTSASDAPQPPVASAADLQRLSVSSWTGSLGYLDYSSGTWDTIPVAVRFDASKARVVRFHIKYPGESQYNESDKIRVSRNGQSLNGERIVERLEHADGTLTLVTLSRGKDDGRKADIRKTYMIGDGALTITKAVRFDGESEFFKRNAFELKR